jgi:hypothetical protein
MTLKSGGVKMESTKRSIERIENLLKECYAIKEKIENRKQKRNFFDKIGDRLFFNI